MRLNKLALMPLRGKLPLRRSPVDAVLGEDQPLEFAGLVHVQPGRPGRRRVGGGNAPTGRVVFVAVERADEAAVANALATQTRPSASHQTTIRWPSHVFPMSVFRSIVARSAIKYQPSGNR